jgi:hypothetical protein
MQELAGEEQTRAWTKSGPGTHQVDAQSPEIQPFGETEGGLGLERNRGIERFVIFRGAK